MSNGIIDRISDILLSFIRARGGSSHRGFGEGSSSDPYLRQAWEELNAYLDGDDESRSSSRDRQDDRSYSHRGLGRESRRRHLRQDYANLETPFGAPFDEVRRAYKRLLLAYHPDRHAGDPEKSRLATEITKQINESYRRIKDFEGKQTD